MAFRLRSKPSSTESVSRRRWDASHAPTCSGTSSDLMRSGPRRGRYLKLRCETSSVGSSESWRTFAHAFSLSGVRSDGDHPRLRMETRKRTNASPAEFPSTMLSDLDVMPPISDLEAEHPGALEVADSIGGAVKGSNLGPADQETPGPPVPGCPESSQISCFRSVARPPHPGKSRRIPPKPSACRQQGRAT